MIHSGGWTQGTLLIHLQLYVWGIEATPVFGLGWILSMDKLHLTLIYHDYTSIIVLFLTWMKEPSVKESRTLTMKKIIWAVKEELQRNPSLFI